MTIKYAKEKEHQDRSHEQKIFLEQLKIEKKTFSAPGNRFFYFVTQKDNQSVTV